MESDIMGYSSEARPTTEERERRRTAFRNCGHVAPSGLRPVASPFNESPAPPPSIEPIPQTDAIEPPIRVHKVTVRPWHHRRNRPFQVGRMEHRGGSYQLMFDVDIRKGGSVYPAGALIDTGAQTSLVGRDLLPKSLFQKSRHPLLLRTVSGEELMGGQEEAELLL